MLLLIAMLSAVASTMPDKVQPSGAKPIGDPGEWIKTDDYPKAAYRSGVTGRSVFRLDIDPKGSVSDCTITQSSGNDGLDATACALLKDRAHFTPARDGNGRLISSTYSSSVAWQIPGLRFHLQGSSQTVSFNVNAAGVVSDCKGEGGMPGRQTIEQFCALITQKADFVWGDGQKPTPKHVVMRSSVDVTDTKPAN